MEEQNRKLPTIQELYENEELSIVEKEAVSKQLLNKPPAKAWVQKHPLVKKEVIENGQKKYVPLEYLPIDKVEYLMNNIFISWRVEIKEVQLIANSVVTTVRVHYLDRITNLWSWSDGVGASPLQTDKGAGACDFNAVKSSSVMMSAPASESYAIKDACEKIGRIFGADLNRKDVLGYNLGDKVLDKKYNNLEN